MLFGVDRSVRVDGGVPGVVARGIPTRVSIVGGTLHVALLFALFEHSSAFAIVLTKIALFVN